jgi:hypothetical protein
LRDAAGLRSAGIHDGEQNIRRALGRLLHVDDADRLTTWRNWLRQDSPPDTSALSPKESRLIRMLLVQLFDRNAAKMTLRAGAAELWRHAQIRSELAELFDLLGKRINHVPIQLSGLRNVPLVIHGRYTRLEMLAATDDEDRVTVKPWREGVLYNEKLGADFFAFTLDKTSGQFSPTTRYRDYAISRELIHWESQSTTTAKSRTGLRYQQHVTLGNHILLFARLNANERAFLFLGPATYVNHVGELPMAITWRLKYALPGDVFQKFAAAVA